MLPRLALTFALAAFVCPAALRAQSPPPAENDGVAPAHVAYVDGIVSLEREGRAETSPLNMPLLSGDRLRTTEGRAEVLFADGSTLHLDMRSTIDVQSDDLVRLTDGRLRLNIAGPSRTVAYRIDSPAGSARITQAGEYRIALIKSADETQLELAVVRGAAEVFTDQGATPVRAGERAYASVGLAPSYAYAYNSAAWDSFDRWSEGRRDVRLGVSSQYLPSDMQSYAPLLDESGDWRYTQSYGYAWYPRVAADWRPYYYGRWASYPRYGWTWIGADRFAWPTHHYGRWGFSAGVWFWIPSSHWAPAYVSWAYAPGYVSWCPLGFDNRPIFAINYYHAGPGYYSPWRAWTAVSYSHFGGNNYWVNQRAVNWDRYGGQRPQFESRPSAPGYSRDVAVPRRSTAAQGAPSNVEGRNSTPIRWAGSRSIPQPDGGSRATGQGDARRSAAPVRDGGAANRDTAFARRDSGLTSSTGRDATVQRNAQTPRYVNRGDEIVRSQTARPTPRAGSFDASPSRSAVASPRGSEARTLPEGPARPARPDVGSRPSFDAGQNQNPNQNRSFDRSAAPSRTSGPAGQGGVNGGAQNPAYQPSYGRPDRNIAAPSRIDRQPERSAPPAPPPGRAEGRPAERNAPPPSRAESGERSAPRSSGGGGVAAPRRGRGGH